MNNYADKARAKAAGMQRRPSRDTIKWLEVLLNDCGLNISRLARNAFLSNEVGREINFVDDLSAAEAHTLYQKLLQRRREMRESELRPD